MKRILFCLIAFAIVCSGVSAASSTVNLQASVAEVPLVPVLFYQADIVSEDATQVKITSDTDIFSDGVGGTQKWDLTDASGYTQTGYFIVKVSGNMNTNQNMNVSVTPGAFSADVDGKTFTTGIVPLVNGLQVNGAYTVEAGIHDEDDVAFFYLYWKGNADLPAGNYSSAVSIEYSIV